MTPSNWTPSPGKQRSSKTMCISRMWLLELLPGGGVVAVKSPANRGWEKVGKVGTNVLPPGILL